MNDVETQKTHFSNTVSILVSITNANVLYRLSSIYAIISYALVTYYLIYTCRTNQILIGSSSSTLTPGSALSCCATNGRYYLPAAVLCNLAVEAVSVCLK